MNKILLKNGNVLHRVNNSYQMSSDTDILISDKYIKKIGKALTADSDTEIIDMSGKLITSGLINTHTHTGMTLLRGVGSSLKLQMWLNKIWPIEDKMTEKDLKSGMELAILEMLSTGTTSFSDMYMMPFSMTDIICRSGIKANLTRVMIGGHDIQSKKQYRDFINRKEAINLYKEYNNSFDGRLLIDFSIHAEYTTSHRVISYFAEEISQFKDSRLHIHLSETESEHNSCVEKYGMTPAELFNSLGAFDLKTFCAHGVYLTENDMNIMSEKQISVVHNPSSNLKLGSGIAPLPGLLKKGINTGLGTDGAASNNNLNMFEEMHLSSILHNGYLKDPTSVQAEQIIDMATLNGALIQGRNDTGIISEGKKADLIAIDLDKPHLTPFAYPTSLLVYSAQGSDVCMTMADGKILYYNGEYLTMDKEKILFECRSISKRLNIPVV